MHDTHDIISLTDYNAFGKPVRSVRDVGGIEAETHYVYDDNLNLIAITDDNGNTMQYTYNERNQRTQIQYADGTTVSYTYTPLGSVDTRTNQASEIVDFDYDALGRISSKVAPGLSQSFTYTANSRLSTAQQQASGHTTNVAFDYDPLGSVKEHVQTVDDLSWTTSYSYDYTGGTATTTYPSGTQVVKSLDTVSRLSQVQQDGMPVAGYSYNMTAGTITQIHGNGLSTLVETDPLKRVTRLSLAVADYRYGYDNVGNRTYMQRTHKSGAPTDVYRYDKLYQLTQVWYGADTTEPGGITAYDALHAYTLDPVGNRLEVENDGVSVSYLPNDGQKLTNPMHRYEQVEGQVLGYDLKGNLLEDGKNSYTYDVQNRQISMIGLDSTAEYVYDALGRRMAKVVDGVFTYYVYNTFYQVLEERDAGNQLLARYTYGAGIDEPLTMERGGSTYTYHRDVLGSITEVTNTSGSLVERYEYDVYGTASIFDSSGTPLTASAIGNPYLFTARRYDPESSNYYYRARMYSPVLGRFLQMDPLGYVDGMNLYAYVSNNPITYVDPMGLKGLEYQFNEETCMLNVIMIWDITFTDYAKKGPWTDIQQENWKRDAERILEEYFRHTGYRCYPNRIFCRCPGGVDVVFDLRFYEKQEKRWYEFWKKNPLPLPFHIYEIEVDYDDLPEYRARAGAAKRNGVIVGGSGSLFRSDILPEDKGGPEPQIPVVHETGHMLGLQHPGQHFPAHLRPRSGSHADYAADPGSLMGEGMQLRIQDFHQAFCKHIKTGDAKCDPWCPIPPP